MQPRPERIAIVGISASGKSAFARELARRTGLPLLHGDQLEWLPNWTLRADAELQAMHAEWLARPRWIIEGWVEPARAERLSAADLVIDLDYSGWRCVIRELRRQLRRAHRAEMPDGCTDGFNPQRLYTVLFKAERRSIDGALAAASIKRYVQLRTPRETRAFLNAL